MKVEISNGELLDKITILQIKFDRIVDQTKKVNIEKEMSILKPYAEFLLELKGINELFYQLYAINEELWCIEDEIREKERLGIFDYSFIDLARRVYKTNDKRAFIKKQIDILSNSNITEEKSYEKY
jgi:triacylglycerol esterase/lipase EstA (alpha/beta hydrolase family)